MMKVNFEGYGGGFGNMSPSIESVSLEAERKLLLEDYYNNFGLLSSINDDGAMNLLREMMAAGNIELYSKYCVDRDVNIVSDSSNNEYGDFIKSLDNLVGEAIEVAKREDEDLGDFKKKILEILFFRAEAREKLKSVCENDNDLKTELARLEETELKKLKN